MPDKENRPLPMVEDVGSQLRDLLPEHAILNLGFKKNPKHGDVCNGMVYGKSLGRWMNQAEFDAWYTSRANHLRYGE